MIVLKNKLCVGECCGQPFCQLSEQMRVSFVVLCAGYRSPMRLPQVTLSGFAANEGARCRFKVCQKPDFKARIGEEHCKTLVTSLSNRLRQNSSACVIFHVQHAPDVIIAIFPATLPLTLCYGSGDNSLCIAAVPFFHNNIEMADNARV